jgi:hypothetical protein
MILKESTKKVEYIYIGPIDAQFVRQMLSNKNSNNLSQSECIIQHYSFIIALTSLITVFLFDNFFCEDVRLLCNKYIGPNTEVSKLKKFCKDKLFLEISIVVSAWKTRQFTSLKSMQFFD